MDTWKYADGLTQEDLTGGDYVGFVYFFQFEDGSIYIGSKQLYKGVKDVKKLKPQSDENGWRTYSSSSKIVNQKISNGENFSKTILWAFSSMRETLLVESALILSVGMQPNCLNLAMMQKIRLPNAKDKKRLYGVIREIQEWLT